MTRHVASLTILLCLFWLINSSFYTMLLLSLGVVSVTLVVLISLRLKLVDAETQPLHLATRVPSYWLWLLYKILQSNLDVVFRIWAGNGSISPGRFSIKLQPNDDLGRVIVANSITLTPGTVSINLTEDVIDIHSLTAEAASDVHLINERGGELNS